MKKTGVALKILFFLIVAVNLSLAQDETERILIVHEAKEHSDVNVAVEAYLIDDILEVTVAARIYAAKPKIDNVIVVGPKLGRLAANVKKPLFASGEEEEEILTTESKGLLGLGSRTKREKKLKGTLVKGFFKFKIPREKILPNKKYELRIKIVGEKIEGKYLRFNFALKDLPKLLLEN